MLFLFASISLAAQDTCKVSFNYVHGNDACIGCEIQGSGNIIIGDSMLVCVQIGSDQWFVDYDSKYIYTEEMKQDLIEYQKVYKQDSPKERLRKIQIIMKTLQF